MKAVLGAVEIAAGAVLVYTGVGAAFGASLIMTGLSTEFSVIADALQGSRGTNIGGRVPAGFHAIVRGNLRIGPTTVWRSTTGSTHRQLNYIFILAKHEVTSIDALYLGGRRVYWKGDNGYKTRNGVGFGGNSDGNDHTGPGGQTYNFGDLVYAEVRYGDQLSGDLMQSLNSNDPKWAPTSKGNPYLGGCAYVYVKVRQDANQFSSEPEVRLTLKGKPVWDPRTGTTAYSENWALHVADHIMDPVYGLGLEVNEEQLIAAANVCDEQVWSPHANAYESRYTLHYRYDSSTAPSDILDKMLLGAAGRVSEIGGEQYIFPAYWQGPTASLSEGDLRGPLRWCGERSLSERHNRVTGTYIAPNYPYAVSGNLYDSNGWYEGQTANRWNFAYQPTNFPEYAKDARHGYSADEYLERDTNYQGVWAAGNSAREGQVYQGADGLLYAATDEDITVAPGPGITGWKRTVWRYLPLEVNLDMVLSVGQAQRVAKILLERNRQEGTGSVDVSLEAWSLLQGTSTFNLTFPQAGWTSKLLEVTKPTFRQDTQDGVPVFAANIELCETAASVYEWDSSLEERPVQGGNQSPASGLAQPNPPVNFAWLSSAGTALTQPDGTVIPRIQLTWDTPLDGLVSQIQQQHRITGTTAWLDDPLVDIAQNQSYVTPCVAGQQYDLRIRSRRSNGATSTWVEIDGALAGLVLSSGSLEGLGKGSLVGQGYSDGTAGIKCLPHTERLGSSNVAMFPSGAVTLRNLQQQTLYYVYYVDPTYTGGDVTPIATKTSADYLGKQGYVLIDTIVTPYAANSGSGGGGGGGGGTSSTRYYPSSWSDAGTSSTATPDAAYDSNLQTAAVVSGDAEFLQTTRPGDSGEIYRTNGTLILSGFAGVSLTADATLSVDVEVYADGGGAAAVVLLAGGTATTVLSVHADQARSTVTATVPSGTDLSSVSVRIDANPGNVNRNNDESNVGLDVYEVFIQA